MALSKDIEELKKTRDIFKEVTNIFDSMIVIGEKEDANKEDEKEFESLMGRFIIKMMELKSIEM